MQGKGNHQQNKKTTHRMGEHICQPISKGVNIQNLQSTYNTQHQKTNNPIKNGQMTWIDTSLKKT